MGYIKHWDWEQLLEDPLLPHSTLTIEIVPGSTSPLIRLEAYDRGGRGTLHRVFTRAASLEEAEKLARRIAFKAVTKHTFKIKAVGFNWCKMKKGKARRAKGRLQSPEVLERVSRLMLSVLHETGVEAAIAGGFAMQIYGSPRLTADVDLLGISAPLDPGAMAPFVPIRQLSFGGHRYRSPAGVEVDVIVRADDYSELYQEALGESLHTEDGLPVISPEYLAAIKFAAGRPKDQDDLLWLLQQEGLLDRKGLLAIVYRLLGGRFARDELKLVIQEADWRSERERQSEDG